LVTIMAYTGGEIYDYRDARRFKAKAIQRDVDASMRAYEELKAMGADALPTLSDIQATSESENVRWIAETVSRLITTKP